MALPSSLVLLLVSWLSLVWFCLKESKLTTQSAHGLYTVFAEFGVVLATAIFGGAPFGAQVVGSIVYCVWAFVTMFAVFTILKIAGILRVDEEEEIAGLDVSEHGAVNYPEFVSSGV